MRLTQVENHVSRDGATGAAPRRRQADLLRGIVGDREASLRHARDARADGYQECAHGGGIEMSEKRPEILDKVADLVFSHRPKRKAKRHGSARHEGRSPQSAKPLRIKRPSSHLYNSQVLMALKFEGPR